MRTYINSLDQRFNLSNHCWCYDTTVGEYKPQMRIVRDVLIDNNLSDVFKTEEEAMYDYMGGAGKRERGFEMAVVSFVWLICKAVSNC